MFWTRLFIPTLREDPAESQNAAHGLLIRAGYMRGRDYLFLGQRTLRGIGSVMRREMDAICGQEVLVSGSMRAIASELRSYRQLPQIWYQFAGFRMKAYSFDLDGSASTTMASAMRRILQACGVQQADPPPEKFADPEGDLSPEEFHTPGLKTIADLSQFTNLAPAFQMKSLVMVADGEPVLALVRGDHQLQEEKLAWVLEAKDLRAARGGEIREWFGADAGSLGPIGAKARVIADEALRGRRNMICGANRNDYHLRHVTPGEDFQAEFHDIRERPEVSILRTRQGVSPLNVSNEAAELVNLTEGVCELSLDRLLEAAVDHHHDADGLALPAAIAPFAALITPVNIADQTLRRAAMDLHDSAPFDVLLDDRDERPGVKFKDADLIGIPFRITLGKKLTQGVVEIRDRGEKSSHDVPVAEALAWISDRVK